MDGIRKALSQARRFIRHSPGFALLVVATVAVAIAATTIVFTVCDSVLIEPLAYRDAARLVAMWETVPALSPDPLGPNPRHFDQWQQRTSAFDGMTLMQFSSAGVASEAAPPMLVGTVTCLPNFFDVLRTTPRLGRTFVAADGVDASARPAIVTSDLAQQLFGERSDTVGRTVTVNGVSRRIIGVLPPDFHLPNKNALREFSSYQPGSQAPTPALFIPKTLEYSRFGWHSDYGNWVAIGRLKPAVAIERAQTELRAIDADLTQYLPAGSNDQAARRLGVIVEPLQRAVVRHAEQELWLLMASVATLMALACVNLANAQVGRVLHRQRDSAIRLAIGATRMNLVMDVSAESGILIIVGATIGVALAWFGIAWLRTHGPVDIPRPADVHLDASVLLFSLLLTTVTTVFAAVLPAWFVARTDPQSALQGQNGRSTGSRERTLLRRWLVGCQVAGSAALLAVTALFGRNLAQLLQQDAGFDRSHVAIAELRLSPEAFPTDDARVHLDDRVLETLGSLPGVEGAGLVSMMMLEGEGWLEPVHRVDRPNDHTPIVNVRWISPGYTDAIQQQIVAGRAFDARDRTRRTALLSQAEAQALFGSENAVGHDITTEGRTFTVVGVVADVRATSLKTAPVRTVYLDYVDRPPYATFFVVRGRQRAAALVDRIRQAIRAEAPNVMIARTTTLDDQALSSLGAERVQTWVLSSFGAAALVLAMLGIYGVLNYAVATRRRELGIRLALGASRPRIAQAACRDVVGPFVGGVAAGLALSVAAERILAATYGLQSVDARVAWLVAGILMVAATAAAWAPVRRVNAIDPIETLRFD